ncbi:MAG: 30S ribosomal protein S7 [Candidatus Pacebacteria bacterium]|nr:30S ribosomal protein S7 [Candidatus Paceibacterota bacterium]MDD3919053.1 30S ribosomal protein S7 [Candidatus Paceibacterota bacterium]
MAKKFEHNVVEPDMKYDNIIVAKFANQIMWNGKKKTALRIVYDAFDIIKEKTKQDPLDVFLKAIENVSPLLEVKPRRVGGATYQVPMEVKGERKLSLAMKWIIGTSRSKKGKAMSLKLSEEIIEASENRGNSVRKREDAHRMAEANRAFAHFAW